MGARIAYRSGGRLWSAVETGEVASVVRSVERGASACGVEVGVHPTRGRIVRRKGKSFFKIGQEKFVLKI